jgi:hypothetical protein
MVGDYPFSDQGTDLLRDAGWDVNQHYTRAIPSHEILYEMFNGALRGVPNLTMPLFNNNNCSSLITSMQSGLTISGKTGFEIETQ